MLKYYFSCATLLKEDVLDGYDHGMEFHSSIYISAPFRNYAESVRRMNGMPVLRDWYVTGGYVTVVLIYSGEWESDMVFVCPALRKGVTYGDGDK